METDTQLTRPSKGLLWTGRVLSALPVLMILAGGVFGLTHLDDVKKQMHDMYGFPEETALPLIIVEIACALLYALPQTAVLGAILLTGYLGGAVATHVHANEIPQAFIPVAVGVVVWLGLLLRDARLRPLVPFRTLDPYRRMLIPDHAATSEREIFPVDIFHYGNIMFSMARAATTSDVFNAIAEPQRRRIIDLLAGSGEHAVNDLVRTLRIGQPAVSKHLAVLRTVRLVSVNRRGRRRRIYRLNAGELKPVHEWVKSYERFWTHQIDQIKQRAERKAREQQREQQQREQPHKEN